MAIYRSINQSFSKLFVVEKNIQIQTLHYNGFCTSTHPNLKIKIPVIYSSSQKLLAILSHKSLFNTFSTSSSYSHNNVSQPTISNAKTKDVLDLTFQDAEAAYKSKTTAEVVRAWIVLRLCSINFLVKNNKKLMKWGQKVLGKRLFEKMMEYTFYGHFVAGEDQIAIQPKIQSLRSFGVKAILDYSAEEDLSHEDAAKVEMESSVPLSGDSVDDSDGFSQYHPHDEFADRRIGALSARTFFYLGEASCERNMETFLQSIEAVSGATKGTGFAAIKMTALGRPQLLLQLSEVIARVHKYVKNVTGKEGVVLSTGLTREDLSRRLDKIQHDSTVDHWLDKMTFDSSGLIHLLPWQAVVEAQGKLRDVMKLADLSTGKMENLLPPLNDREEEMFKNMMRRIHMIFKTASKLDVRVMVDAEQTYFQPAISRLTVEMMRIYNKEKAIVFNTYQCYLKKAFHYLTVDLEQSERQKFYFGAKLVRGAYMDQERNRSKGCGYEDPINESFEATSRMYEMCLEECMKRIQINKSSDQPKRVGIMAATHNESTVRFAIQKMKEYDIAPSDRVICFGQLYGMCDQVSFPLGQSGYSVYKYVPYGPIGEVLPYLSRRAEENSGILGKITKERKLLLKELRRRILRGQIFYRPKGNYEPL